MRTIDSGFRREAADCRRKAESYRGKPEAIFLLRVAHAFDALERESSKLR